VIGAILKMKTRKAIMTVQRRCRDGADWAETLIAVDAEVVPTQVEVMADQLSSYPYEFYDGFRDVWNSQPGVEPTTFWNWIRGRD
jgi:hypothetical protein